MTVEDTAADLLPPPFDPHDPTITAENIYSRYSDMRAQCPVRKHDGYGGYWLVTSYDEVRAAALDGRTFSSAQGVYLPAVSPERLPLLEMDDPIHAAYRKVLAPRFNAVVAKRWEPRIREIINGLVDKFIERGEADLVADLAEPLPLTVIGELFGLDPERRVQVREDALEFLDVAQDKGGVHAKAGTDLKAAAKGLFDRMIGRWEELVAQRRANPTDDLISVLVQADFGEYDASDRVIAYMMHTLAFGGHDTTLLVLSNMLLHLAEHPDQRRRLIDDPSLIPAAVEELLRLLAPLHNFRRDATVDTELGGHSISAGDRLLLGWGAANRDPQRFPNPDDADFARPNVREHLTFGIGPHGCIGQFVARVELVTALDVVLSRLGEYELNGTPHRSGLTGGGHHLGVEYCPVRFTPGRPLS
jgi:cytochrome P450